MFEIIIIRTSPKDFTKYPCLSTNHWPLKGCKGRSCGRLIAALHLPFPRFPLTDAESPSSPSQSFPIFLNRSRSFSILLNLSQSFSILPNPSQSFPILPNPSQSFSVLPQSFPIFHNLSQSLPILPTPEQKLLKVLLVVTFFPPCYGSHFRKWYWWWLCWSWWFYINVDHHHQTDCDLHSPHNCLAPLRWRRWFHPFNIFMLGWFSKSTPSSLLSTNCYQEKQGRHVTL